MDNKMRKGMYAILATVVVIGLFVGLGLIFDTFWKMNKGTTIVYWVTKGIVCAMFLGYALIMAFTKRDKGAGALQLFLTGALFLLPIAVRALCLIPVAGITIAGVLAFLVIVIYLLVIIGLGSYNTIEKNDNSYGKDKEDKSQE